MSEPTREHIEALVEVISVSEGVDGDPWHRALAEAILTSTDPAVLDAMQDALVRAGRLVVEKWAATGSPRRALSDFNPTRLVTEWTEAPNA